MGEIQTEGDSVIQERLTDRAQGRWKELLPLLGVDTRFLSGKQGPCPICSGSTRFRFDDKEGRGTWYCNHCDPHSGNGIDLVMKLKGLTFLQAKDEIERHIGSTRVAAPKAAKSETQRLEVARDQMSALWGRARPLDGQDIASRYLASRGIALPQWPSSLRVIDELPYYDGPGSRSLHWALLAKFAAPDGKSAILHRTFLAEPGIKANVEKPRMFMPGRVPEGGAVRLGPPVETMGIAEGIETALSASQIAEIPVWATCTSGALMKWQPPKEAKHIVIFGDLDASFTGQTASYNLAYRLRMAFRDKARTERYTIEVRFPLFEDPGDLSDDWNDELVGRQSIGGGSPQYQQKRLAEAG